MKNKLPQVTLLFWIMKIAATTLGDFLAHNSGLGFTGGALLIGSLLALTVDATCLPRVSKTLLFWIAFVLTRPFGATMGDILTKSKELGGLNFGTIGSSLILGSILGILILYTTLNQNRGGKTALVQG